MTRRASAGGELETDSERDKRKFASLYPPTNNWEKPYQENFLICLWELPHLPITHAIENIVIEWKFKLKDN